MSLFRKYHMTITVMADGEPDATVTKSFRSLEKAQAWAATVVHTIDPQGNFVLMENDHTGQHERQGSSYRD